jgi:hypothetical protein
LASLGLAKPIKDMGFQLEFNSLTHLVQKLTLYEQCHPDIYQDKFKRQITLVDTEDFRERARGGCHRMDSRGISSVLQMGKAARAYKGF